MLNQTEEISVREENAGYFGSETFCYNMDFDLDNLTQMEQEYCKNYLACRECGWVYCECDYD